MDADLLAAYRDAIYCIDHPTGTIVFHIDELNTELDDLLASHASNDAAWLTASNPGSEPLSAQENMQRQLAMLEIIAATDWIIYPGEGRDPNNDWPSEAGYLLIGCSRIFAEEVARRFGQNALVWLVQNSPPELVLL